MLKNLLTTTSLLVLSTALLADDSIPNPYSANCSALIDTDHSYFVKFRESNIESKQQAWDILVREYNPKTNDAYNRTEMTGYTTEGTSANHLRITFDEANIDMDASEINNGQCFSAILTIDGDKPIKLVCRPYGIRIRCDRP